MRIVLRKFIWDRSAWHPWISRNELVVAVDRDGQDVITVEWLFTIIPFVTYVVQKIYLPKPKDKKPIVMSKNLTNRI